MLEIGSFRRTLCQGMAGGPFCRPECWRRWAALLAHPPRRAAEDRRRVRSVLLLWLWGGPSHLDTFDPKPNAPAEYRGPFSTIPTRTPGVRFTELFPRLAARSDRFTLIRSNATSSRPPRSRHHRPDRLPGRRRSSPPNFGSIVARHRGAGTLPPFMAHRPRPAARRRRPDEGLRRRHLGQGPRSVPRPLLRRGRGRHPALQAARGLTPRAARRPPHAARATSTACAAGSTRPSCGKWDATRHRAYALLTAPEARQALDLSREPENVRDAYGQTSFGQSCLLARRLVRGRRALRAGQLEPVRRGDDAQLRLRLGHAHLQLRAAAGPARPALRPRLLRPARRPAPARPARHDAGGGAWASSAGRRGSTARRRATTGRNVYFSMWAGGGVEPGRVIGESDRLGQEPMTEAVTPAMVGTTHPGGGRHRHPGAGRTGRPAGGRVIHELF